MVNRPANKNTAKKWDRAPQDWYRESPRVVQQLVHGLARHGVSFDDDLIWDPCCGGGNVLDVMERYGHPTVGSDVVDRHPRHRFFRGNVLTQFKKAPTAPGRQTSIITNTPYSYEAEIAERIITHCLESYAVRRAAFILPIAFLASQDRWGPRRLLRFKPSHVCFYRERHTMPPGHLIDQMEKPYEGGMADYVALVFTRPHRWRTEAIWLPVGHFPDPPRVQRKGDDR
jgi:hypothetical protein